MTKLKRNHYIIIAIVAVMILTNPSRSSFGSYLHQTGYSDIGRDFNGIIFSVYSTKQYDRYTRKAKKAYYLGILGNFIKMI